MSNTAVDPQEVISRLATQLGHLHVEVAMRDAALEAAQERIAELEAGD